MTDRLSGFVSALPGVTILTQNVGHETKFMGTETITGKILKRGKRICCQNHGTPQLVTPLKRTEGNYK